MRHPLCAVACAAVVAATPGFAPAAAGGAHDFLKEAIKADNSEILLGRMGERYATTPAAHSFAQMLVDDHTEARSEAVRLAAHLHMRPPRVPQKEAMEERERLRGFSGWAFDGEFARYMVEEHRKDIAKFLKEADARDGAASALARHQLPTLRKHLELALRLNGRFARYTQRQP